MHHAVSRDNSHFFQFLTRDTADATAELYTEVFLQDEPMTRRHGIDPRNFLPYAREYLHFCAEQQLSFVAVDKGTHGVTTFVLGSDLATDWRSVGPGMVTLLSFFRESMAILEELESRCPDLSHIRPGMVFHLFQVGARRGYRKQGLVTRLMQCSFVHAKCRGFGKVIADCTGPVSRHICERCGFHCAAFIAYDDFRIDGRAFFYGLPGGISLMVRDV